MGEYHAAMIAELPNSKSQSDLPNIKPGTSDDLQELKKNKKLSSSQLGELARKMVETQDEAEKERLSDEIMKGFYGTR